MTQGLRELQPYELSAELEGILLPRLIEHLRSRAPGHCMRISDLDLDLMVRLCGRLRAEVPSAEIVILGDETTTTTPPEFTVTDTKLVELRNPLPGGALRPPLLVFVPNELRATVEDSFGVATFEEIQIHDLYQELKEHLLRRLSNGTRGAIVESLRRLQDSSQPWPFADSVSVVRWLLTAQINGNDPEAIGAALYEIGLVPDFELLADPARTPARVRRNRDCVDKLTWSAKSERGRVLDLGLVNRGFRNELGNFLAEAGLEDPQGWTRRITLDRNAWRFAFHRWEFEDSGDQPDSIFIGDVTVDLPVVEEETEDETLTELIGQRILPLGQRGFRKFSVKFRVDPQPSRVQGLSKFTVQVVSKEHGPIGLVRSKTAWTSDRSDATVSFSRLNKVDWEEGWHFVRVLAQTEDGDLIPLVDESGEPIPWATDPDSVAPQPNESDLFYVIPEGDVDVEPPQRAVQREPSLVHALLRLRFQALQDNRDPDNIAPESVTWAERKSRGAAATEMIEVKFGREGAMNLPVSSHLRRIEQKILSAPDGPLTWRLPIVLGAPQTCSGETSEWPAGTAVQLFLQARAAYFEAILNGKQQMISQGALFGAVKELVVQYASGYIRLLRELLQRAEGGDDQASQQALTDLRTVLSLDSVTLSIRDHRGRRREAVLVAPTHPQRALWFATWAALGDHWLEQSKESPQEFIGPARDALMQLLAPMNFPPVLSTASGRLYTAINNLHPFWTLYAPPHEENARGLVGEVCAAFGLPEPNIGGTAIDGSYLASRVKRYLVQHPYITTLVINAFNAGHGTVLADMLLALQREPAFADIRYDIRLFVPDPDTPGVGEALGELLTISPNVTGKEADAFSTPTESHLRPKLRLAIRPTSEFRQASDRHSAHLALLFDIFPAEEVGAAHASLREAVAPLHGLIQDFQIQYREDEAAVAWRRQPRHGQALPLPEAEELTDLLSTLPELLSRASATVATGQTGTDLRPVINLTLDAEERALLHQVHEVSDWVLTMDRNMGIEFFDHGGLSDRPDYLIDYSPDVMNDLGHRLVITSRSVAELESMLRPVLEQNGLNIDRGQAITILDQLRSLSGRLALKLISSPTQRTEALGLALSRLYLEHQGVFTNQIVVPLDAHVDLYRTRQQQADELGDEVSFRRTDLALFDLNAGMRTLTCRLVEVKCYNEVGDLGAYTHLKEQIGEQIAESEEILRYHFDPKHSPVDRPDRLLKCQELSSLLEFYLERAVRYGLLTDDAAEEARFFLRTLENGYRMDFTRSALIFDFAMPGTESPEREGGVEYHRIGKDLIQQLVDVVAVQRQEVEVGDEAEADVDKSTQQLLALQQRREQATSVPTLDAAAFLGTSRERTVSWEELRARRALGEELDVFLLSPDGHEDVSVDEPEEPIDAHDDDGEYRPPIIDNMALELAGVTDDPSEYEPSEPGSGEKDGADESAPPEPSDTTASSDAPDGPAYDVLLGASSDSPQYGLIGEMAGRKIAIDLNQTHTISLFGVQGGGKSYTLGSIVEMASLPIPNINCLPQPLATVIFHYSQTMDYSPEFTSMVAPNSDAEQIQELLDRYGADPKGLQDVALLVPEDKLDERREEYPHLEVHPLKFAASELQASHWRFLMGAVGNQATYIRQLNRIMRSLRDSLTLEGLRQEVNHSRLPDNLKDLALTRLDLASDYIDDSARLTSIIRPGRLVIVDLRDEFIEKDDALGLFVVLLQLFADAKHNDQSFNKLVVFDEAHKYIESPDLVAGLVEVVREMRHKGTSIMVASQDPPSVPVSLIELSSQIILHKFNSPAWLKHIQKANAALNVLTPERMAHLRPGEAYIWSSKATDEAFSKGAIKVKCRVRVTEHGGATKTAV